MRLFSLSLADMRRNGNGAQRGNPLAPMPTYRELRPLLDAEVRRCRRYERPLAVLVFAPKTPPVVNGNGANGAAHPENGNGRHHAAASADPWLNFSMQLGFLLLGTVLRGTLRETDIVAYAPETDDFVVLLPEADATAATRAVERLSALFYERSSLVLRVGTALYPADGLTLDDIVEHARQTCAAVPLGASGSVQHRNGDSA
jgi:hypothetical protein